MTDIKDDPPPIEHDAINSDGMFITKVVSVEHARQIEAAAFARGVAEMQKKVESLKDDIQFVERLAVHHGTKPHMTAEQVLSCIQHYPAIKEITKSYADGVVPNTYDPFAEIAELRAKLKSLEEQKPVALWNFKEGFDHCQIGELDEAAKRGPAPLYLSVGAKP